MNDDFGSGHERRAVDGNDGAGLVNGGGDIGQDPLFRRHHLPRRPKDLLPFGQQFPVGAHGILGAVETLQHSVGTHNHNHTLITIHLVVGLYRCIVGLFVWYE